MSLPISLVSLCRRNLVSSNRNLLRSRGESPCARSRLFSSEASPATSGDATAIATQIESITRHGPGDRVVCLDVGGKKFFTLRSTIAANPVLTEIVSRAEANGELTSSGDAVFVDRDPQHFHVILTYLRNKSADLSYSKKASLSTIDQHVQLPKDSSKLADLYVEATYFGIKPLQDLLCKQSVFTWFASMVGGGNPFQAVSELFKTLRRGLVAAGIGTVSMGSLTDLKFPWSKTIDSAKERKKKPSNDPALA